MIAPRPEQHTNALAWLLSRMYSPDGARHLARYRLHAAADRLFHVPAHHIYTETAELFALENIPAGALHEWLVTERPAWRGDIAAALSAWPTYERPSPADTAPEG